MSTPSAPIEIERFTLPGQDASAAPWLSCRTAGPPGAPVLLFLHGFPEAAFAWDDMLAHFGARYRCIAPNLRGYIGSHAPEDVNAYRAQQIVADLVALIQHHGAPVEAVIAHDWGGALAWGLAAMAPQLMRKLVILNAPHPALFLNALRDDPAQQAASSYMNLLREGGVESRLSADDFALMWGFFERFGGASWLTPAWRARYREAWSATPQAAAGTQAAHSALTGPLNYYRASPLHPPTGPADAIHQLQLPDALLYVRVPTRVIWGEADTALPPSLLDGLSTYVPDLQVTRLPGLSHWLVHEDPNAVAQAIDQALSS
jgi:pimeloyl-ACP methyl ester carboxylesterase